MTEKEEYVKMCSELALTIIEESEFKDDAYSLIQNMFVESDNPPLFSPSVWFAYNNMPDRRKV